MKRILNFCVTVLLLFFVINITVKAEETENAEIEPPAYVTGERTDDDTFFDEEKDLIYYLNKEIMKVSENKSFYEKYIDYYTERDWEFSLFVDNSFSMTDTFRRQTNTILKNIPSQYVDTKENLFSDFCEGTPLSDKVSEIILEEDISSAIIVSDLWNTKPEDFITTDKIFHAREGLYSKLFLFFVPYESTDIEAVKHCEEYALKLVNIDGLCIHVEIVYLDEVAMSYYWTPMYDTFATYVTTADYDN